MEDRPLSEENMQEHKQTVLPDGWDWATLGELALINHRSAELYNLPGNVAVSFVPMSSVDGEKGVIVNAEERLISEVRGRYTPFSEGDVLFAKITPCMENGKSAIARHLVNSHGFGSTEFYVLTPHAGIYPEWIFYFIRQFRFREEAKASFTGSAGQLRVPRSFLVNYPIPLAPTAEQQRIIHEIERRFSQLEAGVSALKRLQANLDRYRAAVMKAAYEGRLLHERPIAESARQLLMRVLQQRADRWQAHKAARSSMRQSDTEQHRRRKSYIEPTEPRTLSLPSLPAGWCWASIEQLTADEPHSLVDGPFGSNLRTAHYTDSGPRVIRLQNIGHGQFIDETAHVSKEHFAALQRHRVFAGDIVIAALGDDLPRACIIPESVGPAIVKADCIRFKPNPEIAHTRYLNVALNAEPLKRIADEVELRLSVARAVENMVVANLKRAERLQQAILRLAFSGKLVPQNPNDEPVSTLLERLRRQVPHLDQPPRSRPAKKRQQRQRQQRVLVAAKGSAITPKLHDILSDAKRPLTTDELFTRSAFTVTFIDDFFRQLRHEIKTRKIREVRVNSTDVYFESVKP